MQQKVWQVQSASWWNCHHSIMVSNSFYVAPISFFLCQRLPPPSKIMQRHGFWTDPTLVARRLATKRNKPYTLHWKVQKNEWNRDRSENARRPKAKTFRQETGWREPHYAGVSVIWMTSAKTFAEKKEICWRQKFAYRICWQKEDLLTTKICWRNLLTRKFFLQNLLKKRETFGDEKSWNICLKGIW